LKAGASRIRTLPVILLLAPLREFFFDSPLFVLYNSRIRSSFDPGFVRRNQAALRGHVRSRVKLFGPLHSFQDNMMVLTLNRRILAIFHRRHDLQAEIRYPYLDRDLMELMYAIPREQVVGVGKRRFLMKR